MEQHVASEQTNQTTNDEINNDNDSIHEEESRAKSLWNMPPIDAYFERHAEHFVTTIKPSYFEKNKHYYFIKYAITSTMGILSKLMDIILFMDTIAFIFCFSISSTSYEDCSELLPQNDTYDTAYTLRFIFTFAFGEFIALCFILAFAAYTLYLLYLVLTCCCIKHSWDGVKSCAGIGSGIFCIIVLIVFITKILIIGFVSVSVIQTYVIVKYMKLKEKVKQESNAEEYLTLPRIIKLNWAKILSLGETLLSGQFLWGLALWELIEYKHSLDKWDISLRVIKLICGVPSVVMSYKNLLILFCKQRDRILGVWDELSEAQKIVKYTLKNENIPLVLWIFVLPMLPLIILCCWYC
eukprot:191965_1